MLKDAANKTGKKALQMLYEGVENRYVYNADGGSIKKYVRRKSATYANPRMVIDVKSNMFELINFDTTPLSPIVWTDPASWVQARILKDSPKSHVKKYGHKAFVARLKAGEKGHHTAVVARVNGRKINKLMSPSAAHMASMAWQEIEEKVTTMLNTEVDTQIGKVLDAKNG